MPVRSQEQQGMSHEASYCSTSAPFSPVLKTSTLRVGGAAGQNAVACLAEFMHGGPLLRVAVQEAQQDASEDAQHGAVLGCECCALPRQLLSAHALNLIHDLQPRWPSHARMHAHNQRPEQDSPRFP